MADVHACFWFDVEDFVTPESDDAALRLARIFSELGESATFKLVGEKARRLKARGREDVIAAMAEHDIGYHSNFHSVHPTVSEYLEGLGWDEGIEEFARREGQGLRDVEDIFGKRCSTYGQPGGSWAPHVYPVLRRWGVPTYVDEASHVGLNDAPFWYCGILNVLRMRSRCTRMKLGGESLHDACEEFGRIATELADEGGGLISIYYHPCEWSTMKFWDGVNFAGGTNTPLDALVAPPLKAEVASERDFADFSAYVRHVAGSGVSLVTCAQLPDLYPDDWLGAGLSGEAIMDIARSLAEQVTHQRTRGGWASAAEAFAVVIEALGSLMETGKLPVGSAGRYIEGPSARTPGAQPRTVSRDHFAAAVAQTREALAAHDRVPSEIGVGGHTVSPASFAKAVARLLIAEQHGVTARVIRIEEAELLCESEVIEEGAFGWSIFPDGFSAPQLMDLARLQAWTLKPATLRK